jgi:phage gp36-like protein
MAYSPRYTGLERLTRALTAAVLTQLTNDGPAPKGPDLGVLYDAIRKGEAEIEMYLGPRYLLPLAPNPPATDLPDAIVEIATELTVYWLYTRRGKVSESVTKRYDAAIAKLEKIRKGELLLDLAPVSPTSAVAGSGPVVVISRTRIFTDDLLRRL